MPDSSSPATSASRDLTANAHYPVTVENCGSRLVFRRAPTRVATNDVNTTEDMVALGLGRLIVGTFDVAGTEPTSGSERVPRQFAAQMQHLHEVAPEDLTAERLASIHADFAFAGWWNYGLQPNTNQKPDYFARRGIKTLVLTESCAQVQPHKPGVSMTDTYRDLENLGKIFDVLPRAQTIVAQMKARIAAVHAKVAKLPPVSVFLYEDDPGDPVTALGLGTPTALFEQAGGKNIFADVKRTWTAIQWRDLADRKPQCIVIDDFSQPSWQQKESLLKSYPAMRDVPAVRNNCFLHLSYDLLAPSPRNAEAVEAIAHKLHPQAFVSEG